ncbi:MAG: AAA family ATPase [Fimbriimonadaceae bacterium]|nr:AAA family ATPase [Fimbriimonadaceae bacterium]
MRQQSPDERETLDERVERWQAYVGRLFLPLDQLPCIASREWVVQGLLETRELVLIGANPKEGKTCLASAIALAVATGTPFAGMPTVQGAVLWLCYEEDFAERCRLLWSSPLAQAHLPLYSCFERIPIDDDRFVGAITTWIAETEARLVVLDPLQAAANCNLERPAAARRVMQNLREVSRAATTLVLHHKQSRARAGQRGRIAGSAQLEAVCTTGIVMAAQPATLANESGRESGRLVTLDCRSRRPDGNQCVRLFSTGPLDYQVDLEERVHRLDPGRPQPTWPNTVAAQIVDCLRRSGPLTAQEIADRIGARVGTVRNGLTRLYREERVLCHAVRNGCAHYRLPADRDGSGTRELDRPEPAVTVALGPGVRGARTRSWE